MSLIICEAHCFAVQHTLCCSGIKDAITDIAFCCCISLIEVALQLLFNCVLLCCNCSLLWLFYNLHRLGRVLMRLRISRDMGLNHGGMLGVGLLLSTALRHLSCSSCLQSWLLLASNLQATSMVVLASFLFMPVSSSSSSHLIMQVWHSLQLQSSLLTHLVIVHHLEGSIQIMVAL